MVHNARPKPATLSRKRIQAVVILFSLLALLCFSAIFAAGCVSASASQSVRDWNVWSGLQRNFSGQVSSTLQTMDSHQTLLNTAIAGGNPDYPSLRKDLASDREALELWVPQMTALDAAATRFYDNASVLNGTAYDAGQRINGNINVYLLNMNAARNELTSYCTNLDAYLAEGSLDYADDSRREAADAARKRALVYLKQADEALTVLDADATALEQAQTVHGLSV